MIKAISFLIILGLSCGLLLHTTHHWTQPYIESNREKARQAVFAEMLGEHTPARPNTPLSARQVGQATTLNCDPLLAASSSTQGYGGVMEFAYIYAPGQEVISLRSVRHQETPGFGDFVDSTWLAELDQSTLAQWQALDGVSGATITFDALQKLVKRTFSRLSEVCHAP